MWYLSIEQTSEEALFSFRPKTFRRVHVVIIRKRRSFIECLDDVRYIALCGPFGGPEEQWDSLVAAKGSGAGGTFNSPGMVANSQRAATCGAHEDVQVIQDQLGEGRREVVVCPIRDRRGSHLTSVVGRTLRWRQPNQSPQTLPHGVHFPSCVSVVGRQHEEAPDDFRRGTVQALLPPVRGPAD